MNLTPPAKAHWEKLPEQIRVKLLNNVWCVTCSAMTGIGNINGTIEKGNLVLQGVCTKCGGDVARVIEGS